MNKKYFTLFLGLTFSIVCNSAFAETDNRWWNEKDIPTLSIIKDLKQGTGREWYVDGTNGDDDTGDGMSLKSPWKTIGKAVGRLKAGDTLAIAAGTYRERFWIRCKGTPDNRVLIGPAGNGEVIIDASEKIEGWVIYQGNIYQAPCLFKPTAVVVDDTPLFPEFSLPRVSAGKWHYDSQTKTIYLSVPGGGNPSLHNVGVIINDKSKDAVFLNHATYVTLYGLTIKYAGGKGVSILGSYNRIEKCNLEFNGNYGVAMFSYGQTQTTNTEIVKNHIYHNFIRNWPRGRYKDGGWGVGAGGSSAKNTQFIGNVVHKNGGEGLSASGQGTIFRDNIVYDNWSVNIYVCNESDSVVEGNLIFCHNPDSKELYNNRDKNPGDGKNLRRLRGEGIMTADENSPATCQNIKILNNVIIGCRRGITHYAAVKDSGLKNVLAANNTIILPDALGTGESYVGIRIPYNNGNNVNAVYRNNIVYGSHPGTCLLSVSTGSNNITEQFSGLTFDHNLWYHCGNPQPFHFGPTWQKSYDIDSKVWAAKARAARQDAGSMFIDPKFVDVKGPFIDAAKLAADSPAMNKALALKEVTVDFFGNPRDSKFPDIGAVEVIQ